MKLQEIKDQYMTDIISIVGVENIIYEEQGENFKIKIQVPGDYEKILKTLSQLYWTMEKLHRVAKLQTALRIEFEIINI